MGSGKWKNKKFLYSWFTVFQIKKCTVSKFSCQNCTWLNSHYPVQLFDPQFWKKIWKLHKISLHYLAVLSKRSTVNSPIEVHATLFFKGPLRVHHYWRGTSTGGAPQLENLRYLNDLRPLISHCAIQKSTLYSLFVH